MRFILFTFLISAAVLARADCASICENSYNNCVKICGDKDYNCQQDCNKKYDECKKRKSCQ